MDIDLTGVPAITLRNPWAHLVAHHGKDVENRTWPPGQVRPVTRLLIHAGTGWDPAAAAQYGPRCPLDRVARAAVVAVAILDRVCALTVNAPPQVWCGCGRWAVHGQYHWRLRHVLALPEPVAARGRQGLWQPQPDVYAAVQQQLAAVTHA
jgi:hypothetical protein